MKPTLREQLGQLTTPALLAHLDAAFPLKDVKPGLSMDEILYAAGCRRVVDFLRGCMEDQSGER